MKKIAVILGVLVLFLSSGLAYGKMKGGQAKGPWVAKVEGNGYLSGGSLPSYGVDETNLGWNFKVNAYGGYNGQLNIIEKFDGQMLRHFKLFDYQVDNNRYSCETHEMRVEGTDDEGQRVAAHFRGWRNTQYPNSVWYWVKNGDGYITNTKARLTLDSPFFILCDEDKILMETLTVDADDQSGVDSSVLYDGLKYQFKVSGVADAGDTIDFDAKYSLTNRIIDDTWTDAVSGYESYGTELLDLMVDGSAVNWGDYNEAHTYYLGYMGNGSSINFSVYDIYYPNNIGSLTVEIYAVP